MWSTSNDTAFHTAPAPHTGRTRGSHTAVQPSAAVARRRLAGCGCARVATRVGPLVVALAVSVACRGDAAAPSDRFAGSWTGVLHDEGAGSGSLQMTLSSNASESGAWSLTLGNSSVAGTVLAVPVLGRGPGRQFTMTCGAPPVGGALLLTASVDGGALQGTYFGVGCANLSRGLLRLAPK